MVVKHFAGKEKKKMEFQYTKDDSSEDSELVNFTQKYSDSEYTKSAEKDESIDDDKKEL